MTMPCEPAGVIRWDRKSTSRDVCPGCGRPKLAMLSDGDRYCLSCDRRFSPVRVDGRVVATSVTDGV